MDNAINTRYNPPATEARDPQPARPVDQQASAVNHASDRQGFLSALNRAEQREPMPDGDATAEQTADGAVDALLDEDSSAADRVSDSDEQVGQSLWPSANSRHLLATAIHAPEVALTLESSAALTGPFTSETLSAMLRQAEASAVSDQPMNFRVLDSSSPVTSLQLTRDAHGWNLRLTTERVGRDALQRQLGVLETALADAGHTINALTIAEDDTG